LLNEQSTIPDVDEPGIRRAGAPPAMFLALALIAGLLLSIAGEGPDFGHYTDWAAAALSGDIFTLRGNVLSPGGVPFSLAAAGPGLLFGVAKALLPPLTLGAASMLTGWVAAIVFWCSALIVLRRVAGRDEWLVLFGAAALFIGTHAGFYSHVYATEVFGDALIAALWALALTRVRWRLLDAAVVGALAGLLALVRAHVVLYALPALWLAVFGGSVRGVTSRADGPDKGVVGGGVDGPDKTRPALLDIAARLMVTGIPIAIALAEYATVNRWMTGSLSHPPYLYGGAGFRSVDLWHPELRAVLLHPWHGLLSYHPLYGVAFAAVALQAWRAHAWRPLWVVTLLAAVAHVWVQAGWYIWWLGGSSFGMRGLAPAALPLVAGLMAAIRQDADEGRKRAPVWLWLTIVACAWSYPMLLRGYTEFFSWPALLVGQRLALVAIVVVSAVFLYASASMSRAAVMSAAVRVGTVAGITAVASYVAWQLTMFSALASRLTMGLVAAAVLAVAFRALRRGARYGDAHTEIGAPDKARPTTMLFAVRPATTLFAVGPTLVLVAALAIFAMQAILFTRLAIRTGRQTASGAPPPRHFEYVGSSPVDELRVTYAEYLGVPGFADRKAAFRRFLAWQRIETSNLAEGDKRVAHAVRQRLDGDPVFGDALIEATARDGVVEIAAPGMSEAQQSRARQLAAGVPGVQSVTFSAN